MVLQFAGAEGVCKKMGILVQKFGGSILDSPEAIKRIADHVIESRKKNPKLVVVVSAMKGTTDQLFGLAKSLSQNPNRRELDMLLTSGERITMSLLAIALHERGAPARSLTGSQSGIVTDDVHNEAQILEVKADRILNALENGEIAVVAGFQGVSLQKEITTLGRGGSDITAIALAGKLGAERCELYKDVDGIFETDPKKSREAKKFKFCSYDDAEKMAKQGARVINLSAVKLARKYKLPVCLLSLETSEGGTFIADHDKEI